MPGDHCSWGGFWASLFSSDGGVTTANIDIDRRRRHQGGRPRVELPYLITSPSSVIHEKLHLSKTWREKVALFESGADLPNDLSDSDKAEEPGNLCGIDVFG